MSPNAMMAIFIDRIDKPKIGDKVVRQSGRCIVLRLAQLLSGNQALKRRAAQRLPSSFVRGTEQCPKELQIKDDDRIQCERATLPSMATE